MKIMKEIINNFFVSLIITIDDDILTETFLNKFKYNMIKLLNGEVLSEEAKRRIIRTLNLIIIELKKSIRNDWKEDIEKVLQRLFVNAILIAEEREEFENAANLLYVSNQLFKNKPLLDDKK